MNCRYLPIGVFHIVIPLLWLTSCSNFPITANIPNIMDSKIIVLAFDDYTNCYSNTSTFTFTDIGTKYSIESDFIASSVYRTKRANGDLAYISKEKVQQFLSKLSSVKLENITYKPIEITPRYPQIITDITIIIYYGDGQLISFSSTSQEVEHKPWKVVYSGQKYVINSGIPFQAKNILEPYFSRSIVYEISKGLCSIS